jgi:hypothetical protein
MLNLRVKTKASKEVQEPSGIHFLASPSINPLYEMAKKKEPINF